jgi:hypothetical protein
MGSFDGWITRDGSTSVRSAAPTVERSRSPQGRAQEAESLTVSHDGAVLSAPRRFSKVVRRLWCPANLQVWQGLSVDSLSSGWGLTAPKSESKVNIKPTPAWSGRCRTLRDNSSFSGPSRGIHAHRDPDDLPDSEHPEQARSLSPLLQAGGQPPPPGAPGHAVATPPPPRCDARARSLPSLPRTRRLRALRHHPPPRTRGAAARTPPSLLEIRLYQAGGRSPPPRARGHSMSPAPPGRAGAGASAPSPWQRPLLPSSRRGRTPSTSTSPAAAR